MSPLSTCTVQLVGSPFATIDGIMVEARENTSSFEEGSTIWGTWVNDPNSSYFESNVTFSPIETSDNGDYTCEAILVSSVAGNVSAISGVHTLAIQG